MESAPSHESGNRSIGRNAGVMVLLLAVSFCWTSAYGSVSWTHKSSVTSDMPIPNDGKQQTCCLVLDVDKDGIDDFVIGERTQAPSVVWYKYNGKGWDKFIIDNTRKNPEAGGDFYDIDRDGDLDIILGQDGSGNNIWWWENPYPDFAKSWTCRYIKNFGGGKHHDQTVGDFDGDGQVEFVSWNQKAKKLLLFEIPLEARSTEPWPYTVIYSWTSGREREGFPSIPTDIDLDGKVDIVGGGRWFKHLGGTKYKENIIDPEMAFTQCAAGQLVKGGRPEVVFSPGDMNGDAKWYEWNGKQWTAHKLRYVVHGHTCEIGDIDTDGNLDILIGEMGRPGAGDEAKTYIWYGDGKGSFHETVAWHGQGIHEGKLGDLDGDGDLDILAKPYSHKTPRVDVLLNCGPPKNVQLYDVHEVTFLGPTYGPSDNPTVQVDLVTEWRHESGQPVYKIYGFWDGDGKGNPEGPVFKVRFCPTKLGRWTLVKTTSNKQELTGQKEGYSINCSPSSYKGFWEVDQDAGSGRWYKRSDGSHPYIVGNTMYSFLSEYDDKGPTGGNIAADIEANSRYFKKVRFSITSDRYPHPKEKPFLDDRGAPTDNGNFSHRPNPAWFYHRVDLAVREAHEHDLIADLILNGPDTKDSRSVLRASENKGDSTPILKYIAARYGSYPNVWICLSNEFDIKNPKYSTADIVKFGSKLRQFLAYPTPVSVHASSRDWHQELNADLSWNDHVTVQKKIKKLHIAADFVARNYRLGGANKPVIDDELAYEGKGDGWSEADVIEAHLGAFLGGGYGTTGHKPASKRGHYFYGNFKAAEHKSADNLLWLRRIIDENITFWKMAPVRDSNLTDTSAGIFRNIDRDFRAMEWPKHEYVLGTNKAHKGIQAKLPKGKWQVICYDIINKRQKLLSSDASGTFIFDAPECRAALLHFKKIGN